MLSKYKINKLKEYERIMKGRETRAHNQGLKYDLDIKGAFYDKGYNYLRQDIINGQLTDEQAEKYYKQIKKDVEGKVGLYTYKETDNDLAPYQAIPKDANYEKRFKSFKELEDTLNEQKGAFAQDVEDELKIATNIREDMIKGHSKSKEELKKDIGEAKANAVFNLRQIQNDLYLTGLAKPGDTLYDDMLKALNSKTSTLSELSPNAFNKLSKRALKGQKLENKEVVQMEKNFKKSFIKGIKARMETFEEYGAEEEEIKKMRKIENYYESLSAHEVNMLYYAGFLPNIEEWYTEQFAEDFISDLEAGKAGIREYKKYRNSIIEARSYEKQAEKYLEKSNKIKKQIKQTRKTYNKNKKDLKRY